MFYAYFTVHEDDSRRRYLTVVECNPEEEPTLVRIVAYVNLTQQTVIKRSRRPLRILDIDEAGDRLRVCTRREYDGELNDYVKDPWFVKLDRCLTENGYDEVFAIRVEATLVRLVADTSIRVGMRQIVPIDAVTSSQETE